LMMHLMLTKKCFREKIYSEKYWWNY